MNDPLLVRRFQRLRDLLCNVQASSRGIAPRAMRCDRSSPSTSSITSAVMRGLAWGLILCDAEVATYVVVCP